MDRPRDSKARREVCEILTARDVIMDSFPTIAGAAGYHSSGTGLHDIRYVGNLSFWSDFKKEVRNVFKEIPWKDYPQPMSARLISGDIFHNEHFRCGAEISTSGRYGNYVLNPIAGIGKTLGYDLCFGDWNVTGVKLEWPNPAPNEAPELEKELGQKNRSSIPDYVLVDQTNKPRAIGEAKHPWGTTPEVYIRETKKGNVINERLLRKFLGQIARDMWAANLKFAFMTNYEWTVFVRREFVDEKWTLFYSDAIDFKSKSILNPGNMSDMQVSVRECMLYLLKITSGTSWSLKGLQREPLTEWVEIKAKKTKEKKDADTPSFLPELQAKRGLPLGKSSTSTDTEASNKASTQIASYTKPPTLTPSEPGPKQPGLPRTPDASGRPEQKGKAKETSSDPKSGGTASTQSTQQKYTKVEVSSQPQPNGEVYYAYKLDQKWSATPAREWTVRNNQIYHEDKLLMSNIPKKKSTK